jgi:phosphoribosylanthranilate isomerase
VIKVKICGITRHEDALLALSLGADALGFVFAPSPRQVHPRLARDIIKGLPPLVKTVGGFVNESPEAIREIVEYCGIDLVQLHGDESPDLCESLMPRSIKALRVRDQKTLDQIPAYHGKVRAILLDAYSAEKRGGTGHTFDWSLALLATETGIPVILSGGLNPGNIQEAILKVRPYGVDVNSGVETMPGEKNPDLMTELFGKIRKIAF